MTIEEKERYKKEVKVALDEYITANCPNAMPEVIMQHLPNMYRYLEGKNLVKYGLNYSFFLEIAKQRFIQAKLHEAFGI